MERFGFGFSGSPCLGMLLVRKHSTFLESIDVKIKQISPTKKHQTCSGHKSSKPSNRSIAATKETMKALPDAWQWLNPLMCNLGRLAPYSHRFGKAVAGRHLIILSFGQSQG